MRVSKIGKFESIQNQKKKTTLEFFIGKMETENQSLKFFIGKIEQENRSLEFFIDKLEKENRRLEFFIGKMENEKRSLEFFIDEIEYEVGIFFPHESSGRHQSPNLYPPPPFLYFVIKEK